MPHIMIDYSRNMDERVDMAALCDRLRLVAGALETFPQAGVRVRAVAVDHVSMADGGDHHGFIDISLRCRGGRSMEVRKDAADKLFTAARDFLADDLAKNSLALSLEVRDLDPELSPKTGSVRDHLVVSTTE